VAPPRWFMSIFIFVHIFLFLVDKIYNRT
jgi:hypothetical protein